MHHLRPFATTHRRQAAEIPDDFINQIKHTDLFKQIADKPEALKALSDVAMLVKELGIDINSTTPPSNMQMFRLASNRKFIKGVKAVVTELRKAGVDLHNEDILEDIMSYTKSKPKGDDS
ncbi:hypothetical protein BV25DRAFT_1910633 [Artomyces pyxidatus]|uniref:Uncharacterized protein n=1 Tax=Artomyces pyxidatus TaxID=48021 RepID=A0ACB8TKA8_9AGAM|nr:hypothetical protein BV25DRAFT_1910633 [Artomyces pyxidatus]